jgi:hypothetical protein
MEKITHAMRWEHWTAIVKACNESGMPKKDWLQLHNINPHQFYRWQNKIRMAVGNEALLAKEQTSGQLVSRFGEVKTLPVSSSGDLSPGAVLRCGNLEVRISDAISDDLLLRIIRAMNHA